MRSIAVAAVCGLLTAISIVVPSHIMGQVAPGPISPAPSQAPSSRPAAKPKPPEVQPRTSLEGAWNLNRDESDDPRTKAQDSRGTAGGNGGGYPGGGYPGGGYPGGGRYPGGGYPGGGYPGGGRYPGGGYPGGGYPGGGGGPYGGQDAQTDERVLQLIRPAGSLRFSLKSAEVDVTDEQYHKLVFYTDGRPLQKPKSESYQEIAAHWSDGQLVSDEKSPQGGKMSRIFELSPDGRQVYETLRIDRSKSRAPLVVRYVYDMAVSQNGQAGRDSDPDQPVLKRHADDSNSSPQ